MAGLHASIASGFPDFNWKKMQLDAKCIEHDSNGTVVHAGHEFANKFTSFENRT